MRGKQGKKPRLLEIGPSASPVAFQHKNVERILLDQNRYSLETIKKSHRNKNGAHYIQADLEQMPIKKGKIAYAEARMVPPYYDPDAQRIAHFNFPQKLKDREIKANIRELGRTMKKGGVVTISFEDPDKDRYSKVKRLFEETGFSLIGNAGLSGRRGKPNRLSALEKACQNELRRFRFKKIE